MNAMDQASTAARGGFVARPLTPGRWDDLEVLFHARGCSVARGCWCMYYRVSGSGEPLRPQESRRSRNQAALRELVRVGPPPGLIGYRDDRPVGWLSLGPREHYAKLARSPVMKPVDAQPVWSVICFVVPSEYRGQGVPQALLAAGVAYARLQGAAMLEAYPVDRSAPSAPDASWFGSARMFRAAGFQEVARRSPGRPVMRLALGPA